MLAISTPATRHESTRECGADHEGWICDRTTSYWATSEDTGREGYWCSKCHAYHGRGGDSGGVVNPT